MDLWLCRVCTVVITARLPGIQCITCWCSAHFISVEVGNWLQLRVCVYVSTCLLLYLFPVHVVPGPIASVDVATVSSTELNISWTPPTSPNGVILHYVLAYTSAPESNIPHKGELTARSDLTSVVLNGLYEGVRYHLRVRAVTEVGPGPELTAEGTTYTAGSQMPIIADMHACMQATVQC